MVEPLAVVGETASEHVGLADVVVLCLHAERDHLDREFTGLPDEVLDSGCGAFGLA